MQKFRSNKKYVMEFNNGNPTGLVMDYGNQFMAAYIAKYLNSWIEYCVASGLVFNFNATTKEIAIQKYYLGKIKNLGVTRL